MKNPCATKNPCAVKRPANYTPSYAESDDNFQELITQGRTLFQDASLSGNGMACASCHGVEQDEAYQATFEQQFPHQVAMGNNLYGMNEVHADEMVQICMLNPMEAQPFAWDSEQLSALSAYAVEVQKRFSGEAYEL